MRIASVSSNNNRGSGSKQSLADISLTLQIIAQGTDRFRRRNFEMREWTGTDAFQEAIWPTKHVTSLTLSYKQTVTANGIVAIARIHRRTVNVYSFLCVGPTYRDMGKVVACHTIFISYLSLQ